MVATQSDLREDKAALENLRNVSGVKAKPVSIKEGKSLASKIRADHYFETSAKTGEGVTEAFHAAISAAELPKLSNKNNGSFKCLIL